MRLRNFSILALTLGSLTACPAEDIAAGEARRVESAPIPDGQDGIGTLYIVALAECDLAAEVLGVSVTPDADVSSLDHREPFTIEDLEAQTVYLAAFLDDDLNADPAAPAPSPGDLVHADIVGDGVLSCVEVHPPEFDIDLQLNGVRPGPSI